RVEEVRVLGELRIFLEVLDDALGPGLPVRQLAQLGNGFLLGLTLAVGVECLGQSLGKGATGEERIRGLLVAGVRRAPFDPLLGRVVLSRVVLALAAPGVDLAPRLVALAGEAPAVVVVLHHGYPSPPGSGLPEGPEHLSPEGANRLAFRGRHRSWTVLLGRGERLVDEPDQLHRGLRRRIALERLGRDRRRGGAICVLENGVQLERQLAEDPPTFVREPPLVKGAEEGILPVLERIVQPVPGAAVHRQPGTDSLDVSRVRTGRSGRTRCRRLRRPRPRDGRPLLENEPRRGG